MWLGYRKRDVRALFQTCLILLLVDLLILPPGLSAQTPTPASWLAAGNQSQGGDGSYSNAANWNCGVGCTSFPDNTSQPGGPFAATINSGVGDIVNLAGLYTVTTLTVGGSGTSNPSTLNIGSGASLTLANSTPAVAGDVLTIANGGTLNIQGGGLLTINNPNAGNPTTITNIGTISIGDAGAGTLTLNGANSTFTISTPASGNGSILLSDNAGNQINGASGLNGSETLVIAGGTNLSGAGSLNVANFTNNGTIAATSTGNALIVNSNLTNWTAGANTLNGGQYIANGGTTLQLASIGAGQSIRTVSNANLVLASGGSITGFDAGVTNTLSGLTYITDASVNVAGLGTPGTPFTITPTTGTLTMTSNDSGTSELTLDSASNVTVNGAFRNLTTHDVLFQGSANTSTLNVLGGSTLTTGAFTNEASVNGPDNNHLDYLSRTSIVNVSGGSTLAVSSLTTSTDNGYANSQINIDGSTLTANSIIQGGGPGQGDGRDVMGGQSDINLTNHSTGTVTGSFQNSSDQNAATLKLDQSQFSVTGSFIQSQPDQSGVGGQSFLKLDHNSTMTVGTLQNSVGFFSDGTPQSHVSVNNGSTLTVTGPAGSFTNVSGGVLNGGDYYVGQDSSLNYTGTAITTIGSNTSVTLDHNGVINNGVGSNALSNSLITNNGSLALLNGASLNLTTLTNVDSSGVLSGGNFEVGNGSTLQYGGVDITAISTKLTLDGTGKLVSSASTDLNPHDALSTTLSQVNGSLTLQNSASIALTAASFTNSGTVSVLSGSTLDLTNTHFTNVTDSGVLSGGSYVLGNSSSLKYTGPANINTIDVNTSLTLDNANGCGCTTGTILNNGVDALSNSLATNNGTLALQNGASLTLASSFTNFGLVSVKDSATLTLSQASTNLGTLTATEGISFLDIGGSGQFQNGFTPAQRPSGQGAVITGHASPPGTLNVNDGASLAITDFSGNGSTTITNYGSINVNGQNSPTALFFDSGNNTNTFILAGTGQLNMTDSDVNFLAGAIGNETLINNSNIQGSGTIFNFENFTNNGSLTTNGNAGLVIDLTNFAPNSGNADTFTNGNGGQVNVGNNSGLIIVSNDDTTIINNGTINLGDDNGSGTLVLSGAPPLINVQGGSVVNRVGTFSGTTFTLGGNGTLNLVGGDSLIVGQFGNENLVNDVNHTIFGTGGIDASVNNFTNNGTLEASGGNLFVDSNLTNWDGGTGTLAGGAYIADAGSTLQLSSIGGDQINTLSGASVTLRGSGFLTGDGSTNALSSLSSISSGPAGNASLSLQAGANLTITPTSGVLTVSADDSLGGRSATLQLDGSSTTLNVIGDLTNTANSSNNSTAGSSVNVSGGASLTVDNLTNTASGGLLGQAQINVIGSTLTVNGNVANTGIGLASASIGVSGAGSSLTVNAPVAGSGTFTNTNASLTLSYNAAVTVAGLFTNDGGSSVKLDTFGTGFSTLTTNGGFSNSGSVSLNNNSTLANTGAFTNSGLVTLTNVSSLTSGGGTFTNTGTITTTGPPLNVTQPSTGSLITTHVITSNSINVTGDIFNTSPGIVNLNGAGDNMTATGQFTNTGAVNLNGSGASVSSVGFDNQVGGVVTLASDSNSVGSTGPAANGTGSNEGTIQFNGTNGTVSSTGDFTNSSAGVVTMAGTGDTLSAGGNLNNAGTITIGSGEKVTATGNFVQTDGTTTIDAGGTLTAALVDLKGGTLIGGGEIDGNVLNEGGTLSPGDPQEIDVIGDYTQVLPGIMDLHLASSSSYDQVDVTGTANLGGILELTLEGGADNFDAALGFTFDIINWSVAEHGDFDTFIDPVFDHGAKTFQESFNSNGTELDLLVVASAPEPSTLAMFFGAVLLGAGVTWRKRRSLLKQRATVIE